MYLILGNAEAGRREVLCDLIEGGLEPSTPVTVALHSSEKPNEAEAKLANREATTLIRYEGIQELLPPDEESLLFVLMPGLADPADTIESFQGWLKRKRAELARIIAVIDCRLGAEEPGLRDWFDCLAHFADAVLLSRREGLSPKWSQDFVKKYEALHYPCLLEYVKKGRVGNPVRVLDPLARRMALLFDDIDAVDQMDIDPDNLPEEPIDLVAPSDPWLERNDGGQRVKRLPDIRKYLVVQ